MARNWGLVLSRLFSCLSTGRLIPQTPSQREKDISVGFKAPNCYPSVVNGEYFQKPDEANMLWSQRESCVGACRVGVSWDLGWKLPFLATCSNSCKFVAQLFNRVSKVNSCLLAFDELCKASLEICEMGGAEVADAADKASASS